MSQAALLGIVPKYFARPGDRMELEDLDRWGCFGGQEEQGRAL
jgi:hypothetical protein